MVIAKAPMTPSNENDASRTSRYINDPKAAIPTNLVADDFCRFSKNDPKMFNPICNNVPMIDATRTVTLYVSSTVKYSAMAALSRLTPREAVGTTRSAAKAAALAPLAEMRLFDGSPQAAETLRPALTGVTHVLVSIAPAEGPDGGDRVLPVLAEALAAEKSLVSVAYLSTVGVYGDHDGAWVDETSECRPKSAR